MKTNRLLLIAGLLCICVGADAQSRLIGELHNVKGDVILTHGEDSDRALTMTKVQTYDIIDVKTGSADILFYNSGTRYHIGQGCKVRVAESALKSLLPHPLPMLLTPFRPQIGGRTLRPGTTLGTFSRGNPLHRDGNMMPFGAVVGGGVELTWDKGNGETLVRLAEYRDGKLYDMKQFIVEPGITSLKIDDKAFKFKKGVWYLWAVQEKRVDSPVRKAWLRLNSERDQELISDCQHVLPDAEAAARLGDCSALLFIAENFESVGRFDLAEKAYVLAAKYSPTDEGIAKAVERTHKIVK